MQTDWKQALIFPLFTGATLLVFEYFIIQPWLRYKETQVEKISGDSERNQRKWVDWIRNAIIHFKRIPNSHYQWSGFSIKQNFVSVSEMIIGGGQAELIFSVTERYILDFSKPKEVSQYHMIIDRGGNINRLKALPLDDEHREVKTLPFPASWLVIGTILLITVYSQLPKEPSVNKVNGLPVPDLWASAPQITPDTVVNGTIGGGEVDSYIFGSNAGNIITIKLVSINEFDCKLQVYNMSNLLIDGIYLSYSDQGSMSLAPELNASYLVVISSVSSGVGGSYTVSISTANSAP